MNIYIGNLHYNVNEEELKEIFKEYGEVMSVIIITDKYTGRSKGFGFIEMRNDEEANKAINNLNGTEIRGRIIKVNQAKERGK
jgi:RNA recognition motif-containing protein